jgi:hypothetical protein
MPGLGFAGVLPDGAFTSAAAGTTSAAFLREPFGARAAAMGGAVAASASGAEALYQNPAGLSAFHPESPSEVALGYDALLETAYQGAAAYARPLGADGALALGFIYASQSAQTAYTALGDSAGQFTPLDLAVGAGYARRLGSLSLGAGLKFIRSKLGSASGDTAAADFGALARHVADLGEGPLDLGASVSNLGPPLKLGSSADALPLRVRGGGLWHVNPNVDLALDVVFPVDQDPYAAFGCEARLPAAALGSSRPWSAALRFGYDQNRGRGLDDFSGISLGGGVDVAAVRLDYAWILMGALGSANRVTLAARF